LAIQTVLRVADAVADVSGLLRRPMDGEKLLVLAQRRTNLAEFGEACFVEPLRRLLTACQQEASLSLVGRIATKWDAVRFLNNLLQMRDAEARDPGVLRERIERPIFITGLPRSGTTFLHRLLMADPDNRSPRVWQTIYPYPSTRLSRGGRDRRQAEVARQLGRFERLAPEFRSLHPLEADSPQECSEITAHVFRSLRFDTTYRIPSYRAWLDGEGHLPAYRFHQRFLQHLQHQAPGGRWVLKCPDHLFALDALREVYPGARLVFVHRDPARVLASVARLTEVLRRPFTRRIDRAEIGHQESARWQDGAQRMVAAGDDVGLPEKICHVHHTALVTDPVGTVAAVYRHFGLTLSETSAATIARYVDEEPTGGYGAHSYRFEDYGLDEQGERQKFCRYMQRFGVEPEGNRAARPPVASAA
jgi:Sulfotransferase family